MKLEFELSEQEFLDYNYYVRWSSPDMRPVRLKYYTTNLGLYIVSMIVLIFWRAGFIPALQWIIPFGAILLIYASKIRQNAIIDERGQKYLKLVGRETILGKQTLTITSGGIEISKQHSQSELRWDRFHQFRVANQSYYLFITPEESTTQKELDTPLEFMILQPAVVIPFRVFDSDNQRKQFNDLLARYLPV